MVRCTTSPSTGGLPRVLPGTSKVTLVPPFSEYSANFSVKSPWAVFSLRTAPGVVPKVLVIFLDGPMAIIGRPLPGGGGFLTASALGSALAAPFGSGIGSALASGVAAALGPAVASLDG